jgi:hypothetical protein
LIAWRASGKINTVGSTAPIIFAPGNAARPHPTWARLIALAIAGGCLTLLVLAARLPPSHSGYGTHRGLGLPDCQFLQWTGLPCPSCGMTTSFAWFVRGNIVASLYVQPMGTLLAMLCGCCVWIGLYVAVTGRPVYRLLELVPQSYWLIPLLAVAIAAWGWKILIHLSGHDGW